MGCVRGYGQDMGHRGWDVEALNGGCGEIQDIWRSGGYKGIFGES